MVVRRFRGHGSLMSTAPTRVATCSGATHDTCHGATFVLIVLVIVLNSAIGTRAACAGAKNAHIVVMETVTCRRHIVSTIPGFS